MYIDFYGLISEPFRTTPDADAVFFSPSHREALSSLLYGVKERKGVIVITGEVGVGKTTIIRRYLTIAAPLPQKTVHIYNPNIAFERLLFTILTQVGIDPGSGQSAEMVSRLHEFALTEQRHNRAIVLVIDEAQCMPVDTLEGIRMLSNLETAEEKLIQIVLMGQPELDIVLDRHELRHVRERIALRGRILPLTRKESLEYIQHRLLQASRDQRPIFSAGALSAIVKTAQGIPRRLNILCDNALIAGFRLRQPTISRATVTRVIAEREGIQQGIWWNNRMALTAAAAVLLTISVLIFALWNPPRNAASVTASESEPTTPPPGSPSAQPTPPEEVPLKPMAPVSAAPLGNHPPSRQIEPPVTAAATDEPFGVGKVEASETARLLAVLLDSGRVVLGKAQPTINNPRLEDKDFSASVFEGRLRKEFLARTGHDIRALPSSPLPERAKPLLQRLVFFMQKEVQDAQRDINKKGIGFKGFIPATFATRVAQNFSKDTGLKLRQIGPPGIDSRNPDNKPDEREEQTLLVVQKNHPRVGDHVMEQQLPDRSIQVLLPLFYNKPCLACHGKPKGEVDISGYNKEGFKEGDLGGAISVVLPIEMNRHE